MSEPDVILEVDSVAKRFCRDLKRSLWYGVKDIAADSLGRARAVERLRPGEFWALGDVSFSLRRGECLGLVGSNGAGKTTLLRLVSGLIKPDRGEIRRRGRMGALIALGAGFNPVLTGRENIYVNAAILGLTKRETEARLDEIIAFAEIGDALEAPVQSYSSGMTVRLGFAIAAHLEPDLLLIDEVLAVGDLAFREKCLAHVTANLDRMAVVFVSHNNADLCRLCTRALWLEKGVTREMGPVGKILGDYSRRTTVGAEGRPGSLVVVPLKIAAGGDLELGFERAAPDWAVGVSRITVNVLEPGHTIAAQAEVHLPSGGRIGDRARVTVSNLHLADGVYHAELLLWRDRTFLGKIGPTAQFTVEGRPKLWGCYQPAAAFSSHA